MGTGLGEKESLKVVDVVVCLVVGAGAEWGGVEEVVLGREGGEKIGEVGGEELLERV